MTTAQAYRRHQMRQRARPMAAIGGRKSPPRLVGPVDQPVEVASPALAVEQIANKEQVVWGKARIDKRIETREAAAHTPTFREAVSTGRDPDGTGTSKTWCQRCARRTACPSFRSSRTWARRPARPPACTGGESVHRHPQMTVAGGPGVRAAGAPGLIGSQPPGHGALSSSRAPAADDRRLIRRRRASPWNTGLWPAAWDVDATRAGLQLPGDGERDDDRVSETCQSSPSQASRRSLRGESHCSAAAHAVQSTVEEGAQTTSRGPPTGHATIMTEYREHGWGRVQGDVGEYTRLGSLAALGGPAAIGRLLWWPSSTARRGGPDLRSTGSAARAEGG